MKNNRFKIGFLEFSFLVEACIPPTPIARAVFWQDVIDKYYHVLTVNERQKLHSWICRNSCFDLTNEDCALFDARFNPDNQYEVETLYNGKRKVVECFKWQGEYHTTKNTSVAGQYITKVEPLRKLTA